MTFAWWSLRIRTALLPFREKGSVARLRGTMGHFLRSGFRKRIAELRRFPAIFRRQPGFSATQTVWRRMQSRANPSPPEFPANREKYREFVLSLGPQMSLSSQHLLPIDARRATFTPDRNRQRTGNYQGDIRGPRSPEQGKRTIERKATLYPLT